MKRHIDDHVRVVQELAGRVEVLQQIAQRIIDCFENGGRVYLMGNGGSAADAQHIAAELVGRFKANRRPLPAVALTTDSSNLTAIANDLGFEQTFERQILALTSAQDIVWALSVSGTSANIIRGLEAARKKEAFTIGFTSSGQNDFDKLCDLCLRVNHTSSDRVQEAHQLAYHLVCEAVESHFAK